MIAYKGLVVAVLALASGLILKSRTDPPSTNVETNGLVGMQAPELGLGQWINSSPLKLADLRGKVVLLEFWTYGCYNCRNTIPYLRAWYKEYGGNDFEIIGIHTPEFPAEKELSRVVRQTQELGIRYPVVTDNDMTTWNAYHQEYWPVLYLIDEEGIIRYVHIGEGEYQETESRIKELIGNK